MAELVSIKRNVDVSPGQAAPAVFHCSQGDVGSKIILGLLNNGTAYSIPSGVTVTIEGSESNGSIFTPISATASGSDITFYLTGEMTAVAGPAICQAVLKSGSNILGTANFTLEVESSPMGADAPPVFTDAGWTWMLNKLNTEFVPALDDNIIDAIDSKADQSDLTALSNTVAGHTGSITVLNNTVNTLNGDVTANRQNIALKLDKNQGTANAGKYLKVNASGVAVPSSLTEVAPLFDENTSYKIGDYVINNGVLYRFVEAHPAGVWDSSHVVATDAGKIFKSIDQSTQADNSEIYYLNTLNWEQGAIDATTGELSGNGRRIRAKLTGSNIKKISADGRLFFTIFAFSGDTYVGEWNGSSWEKTAVRIIGDFDATILDNYNYAFWIMGGYIDNSPINPSIGALFHIYCGKLSETNDIISRVLLEEKTLPWEQGGYNVTSGAETTAMNRIRRAIDENMINIKVSDDVFFTILAFSGDTYIGTWDGRGFKKEACRLKDSQYIAELFDYNYTFFVMCGHDDNSSISPADGVTDVSFIVNGAMNTVINRIDAITLTKANPAWWQRSINVSTGDKQTAGFRIIAELSKFCYTITAPSNMFFTILAYSGDTYVGVWDGTTFKKEAFRLKNTVNTTALRNYNYIYWIMVGYDNNSSITPSEGSNVDIVVDQIETEREKSKFAYSYSPNIIFQCRNVDDTRIPPESKWSIKAAAENQYDRVRCTVRATTGGEYFLCHDTSINNYVRNKDGSELSETVLSEGRTLAELNQYDWGIKYGPEYAGATVPMLEDFLKYSAIFNMGVTWHAGSQSAQTDAALDEQIAMIDKYGLTDNLIVISSGQKLNVLQKFVAHNPRVSCYVGGLPEYFEDASNLEIIEALQTPYNKIYVQLFPWGTAPTDEFIALAKSKNWLLYDSITMTETDLCNEDMFAKGYSLREVNNVYMVKDTVRRWANSIF